MGQHYSTDPGDLPGQVGGDSVPPVVERCRASQPVKSARPVSTLAPQHQASLMLGHNSDIAPGIDRTEAKEGGVEAATRSRHPPFLTSGVQNGNMSELLSEGQESNLTVNLDSDIITL